MAPDGPPRIVTAQCTPTRNGCVSSSDGIIYPSSNKNRAPANSRLTLTAFGAVIGGLVGILGLGVRIGLLLNRRQVN